MYVYSACAFKHSTFHGSLKNQQLCVFFLSTHQKYQTLSSWKGLQGRRRVAAARPQPPSGMCRQAWTDTLPSLIQTVKERRKKELLAAQSMHTALDCAHSVQKHCSCYALTMPVQGSVSVASLLETKTQDYSKRRA